MQIEKLILCDYRNIKKINLNFDKNVIILYGENGQGKTNIVESIYMLAKGQSFRTNYSKEIIGYDKEETLIEGKIKRNKISNKQKIILKKNGKACFVNDIQINKFSEYLGNMNAICFCPEDVSLFKDSPSIRRHFLDSELSSLFPVYVKQLILCKKYLDQRNDLLKQTKNIDKCLLEVLDEKLIETSYDVFTKRKRLISYLESFSSLIFNQLTDSKENIRIIYKTFLDEENKDIYLDKAKKIYDDNLDKDIQRLYSNVGIHKDDFVVYLNDKEVDMYASQGQQRIISLTLKLAMLEIAKKVKKEEPILILDDAFSELDKNKKTRLLNYVFKCNQVFITCTDYRNIVTSKTENATLLKIKDGNVIERNVI